MKDTKLTLRPTAAEVIVALRPLVSKDNKYVLSCCGCDIKVLSIKSGEAVNTLRGHKDLITSIIFNPSNQYQVLSSSLDGTIRKWNFEDGILINVIEPQCTSEGGSMMIHGMYSLPNEPKSLIYLIKTLLDTSEQTGQYRFMKQSVNLEQWSSGDFVSKPMRELPISVSIGGQGAFMAAVTSHNDFTVYDLSCGRKNYRHRVTFDKSQPEVRQCLSKITSLAAHPTQHCVAVGHSDGKINIWTNVVSKNAIHTWVHWHALPVLSLTYTPEGTYLLSGGHESVVAKWSHESYGDQSQREYLPRVGAPVSHIAISADNSVYVTSHMDNSVKVIKNWIVVQVFQGLARDYLSRGGNQFPVGVKFEPRSGALVTNGLPGHLQFYSLSEDKLLYNLDIVGQNYTSGESLTKQHCYTVIEICEFSHDGSWMVTVERWAGSYSHQCRMKLWFYDSQSKSYVLNTDVDTPHQGRVSQARFAPIFDPQVGQSQGMLVTVGAEDNKFKLWRLTVEENSDGSETTSCWRVESTGYYKNKPCLSAAFSDDRSVLAVGFGNVLTLWDPIENHMCTSITQREDVTEVRFCGQSQSIYLVMSTSKQIIVWNLITYAEHRTWDISQCRVLSVNPQTSKICAFTDRKGYVMSFLTGKITEFKLPKFARHITSLAFTPSTKSTNYKTENSHTDLIRHLYVSTKSGSILMLDNKNVEDTPDLTPTVEQASKKRIASNYQPVTPLATLLSSQLVQKDKTNRQIDSRTGLAAASIIKQIGDTACVAMPSINTLCRAFLTSLLLDKNTLREVKNTDVESSDEEMDVDDDSSDGGKDEKPSSKYKKLADIEDNDTTESKLAPTKLKKSDILNFSHITWADLPE